MKSLEQVVSALECRLGEHDELILSVLELAELADGMKPMRGDVRSNWSNRSIGVIGTCGNCGFKWPVAHMPMNAERLAQIMTRLSICSRCGETELVFLSQVVVQSHLDRGCRKAGPPRNGVPAEIYSSQFKRADENRATRLKLGDDEETRNIFVGL